MSIFVMELTVTWEHASPDSCLVSFPYRSNSCFLTKILPCAFLSREALSDRLNRKAMSFKLPHEVVFACAKRDEPPSRRRLFQFSSHKIQFLPQPLQNHGRRLRGILFLQCIQWTTNKIRVYSSSFVVHNQRFILHPQERGGRVHGIPPSGCRPKCDADTICASSHNASATRPTADC